MAEENGTAMVKHEQRIPAIVHELSVQDIVKRTAKVYEIAENVMKEGVHFGKIPGTDKPTLYQPGADILNVAFMFSPKFERIDAVNYHSEQDGFNFIKYSYRCILVHYPTGKIIAEGIGSANSKEPRYRYRNEYKDTGNPVPRSFWKDKDVSLIGGKKFVAKKNDDGQWMIFEKGGRIENPDIYELDNTIDKIAQKRAKVGANMNATGCSAMFTQDLEDFQDPEPGKTEKTKEKSSTKTEAPEETPAGNGNAEPINARDEPDHGTQLSPDSARSIEEVKFMELSANIRELGEALGYSQQKISAVLRSKEVSNLENTRKAWHKLLNELQNQKPGEAPSNLEGEGQGELPSD